MLYWASTGQTNMTINEFEHWFETYSKDVSEKAPGVITETLDERLADFRLPTYHPNAIEGVDFVGENIQIVYLEDPCIEKVIKNINKVTPIEDRDFLTLKYSKYLNYSTGDKPT
jgi:hypothetical protein